MPISPTYEWDEDDEKLEVRVAVLGAARDVFATSYLLKVNSPPYLLMVDLHDMVDESKTIVTISPAGVTFRLFKAKPGVWGQLEAVGEKEAILKRRNESVDRAHARIEAVRQQRLERKKKEEREATDRQIDLDRKKRMEIEERKRRELDEERSKLVNWQKDMENDSDYEEEDGEGGPSGDQTSVVAASAMPDHPDYHGRGWRPSADPSESASDKGTMTAAIRLGQCKYDEDSEDDDKEDSRAGKRDQRLDDDDNDLPCVPMGTVSFKPLPPPRLRLEPVRVEFTKLETGHLPARENREEEIRLYKKSIGKDSKGKHLEDSVDVSDRQPVFLKDKGDALYKQGNYRGALNAYGRALEVDPEGATAALWSNAAACYLQLGEHEHCTSNCTRALELLRPGQDRFHSGAMSETGEAESYRRQMVRALVRRGQARSSLGLVDDAETDYVEALRYDPGNASIVSDLEELRATMQPALDAAALRQRGNARFQAKDYEGAVEAFSLLVGLNTDVASDEDRVAAFSNRAACLLVLEKYEAAVLDCTAALKLNLEGLEASSATAHSVAEEVETGPSGRSVELDRTSAQSNVAASPDEGPFREWLSVFESDGTASDNGSSATQEHLWPFGVVKAQQLCRVLVRRGAAHAHMKQFGQSMLDYESAAILAKIGGDMARALQLESDVLRLQGMASELP